MTYDCPPALVCWLLESFTPAKYREAMLGDLIEEYNLRAKSASPLAASRWFWSQACRSIPSIVWSSLRSGNWLISMSIAAGVYIVMAMLKLAADSMISKLGPAASDASRPCAGCVSLGSRNRWLRGRARSPWCKDLPRIDGNDYRCRLDRTKGLHNTSPVVVSVWVSDSGTYGGTDYSGSDWDSGARSCTTGEVSWGSELITDQVITAEGQP